MESLDTTPTEPVDYAAISAAYGSLLGALVVAQRTRHLAPLDRGEIASIALATFALSRIVAHEKVESWLRRPFVEESPDGERHPRGRRLRYAVGELMTCTRCLGAWSALGIIALRATSPATARTVIAILAAQGGNDFLQTGFSWACAKANAAAAEAEG